MWKVRNWDKKKSREFCKSNKFELAGSKWYVGCYSDGDTNETRGFVAIYLFPEEMWQGGKRVSLTWVMTFINRICEFDSVKVSEQKI